MEDLPQTPPQAAPAAPNPSSPGPAEAPSPSVGPPQGFVSDLKSVLTRDGAGMLRVAKNAGYLPFALIIYALVQVSSVVSSWLSVKATNDLLGDYGFGTLEYGAVEMVKQGVFSFVVGLAMMAALYFISIKLFKAKPDIDVKGFITLWCFLVSPMVLILIPIVNIVAGIWVIVLFFSMMKHIFAFSFWKALGAIIVTGIIVGIVAAPLGALLGISSGTSFEYSLEL